MPRPRRPLRPNRFAYRAIVFAGVAALTALRVDMQVTGAENLPRDEDVRGLHRRIVPGRGRVVAITHFGYADFVFAELAVWREVRAHIRFLITRKHTGGRVVTAICELCDHVLVDRSHGEPAFREAVAKLRRGDWIGVFPEGTTNRAYAVRELRTGAVRMAQETGAEIIPLSVFGAHRMLAKGRGRFLLRNAWRTPVRVHVAPPIRVAPDEDVRTATAALRATLQDGIDRAIDAYPVAAELGVWWMPAARGGGAITPEEDAARHRDERKRFGATG